MKDCMKCGEGKPFSDFPTRNYKGKKSYRNECKACTSEYMKSYAEVNSSLLKVKRVEYSLKNSKQAVKRATEWKKKNSGKVNFYTSKRRASKTKATPHWLTEAHHKDIKAMYLLAKKFEGLCGIKYHVDHIVPLKGDNVCGLHVPWNLQLLPASINISKSNKYVD